jgi:hypothetical protein
MTVAQSQQLELFFAASGHCISALQLFAVRALIFGAWSVARTTAWSSRHLAESRQSCGQTSHLS